MTGPLNALMASWDEKFANYTTRQTLLSGQSAADQLTAEAALKLDCLGQILTQTLKVDDKIDWEILKDKTPFPYPKKFPENKPSSEPTKKPEYQAPKISWLEVLFGKKVEITALAEEQYSMNISTWEESEAKRKDDLAIAIAEWEQRKADYWSDHDLKKIAFEREQSEANSRVDFLRTSVANGDEDAVIEHASLVLEDGHLQ